MRITVLQIPERLAKRFLQGLYIRCPNGRSALQSRFWPNVLEFVVPYCTYTVYINKNCPSTQSANRLLKHPDVLKQCALFMSSQIFVNANEHGNLPLGRWIVSQALEPKLDYNTHKLISMNRHTTLSSNLSRSKQDHVIEPPVEK
jgi:hypothetical protein